MKLNEYIHERFDQRVPKKAIEEWIVDWYKETYNRMPPTWLAIDSSKHELLDELKKELKE